MLGLSMSMAPMMTQGQRILIEQGQHDLRHELAGALHGTTFTPKATCPCHSCRHPLTDFEITKGFLDDPHDYTTGCPKCGHRFLPRLHSKGRAGSHDVAYYCPSQTLDRIRELTEVPFDEFQSKYAGEYNSATIHFGGLRQAFKKVNVVYKYEADLDWKKYVPAFLGKLSDRDIASLVGVSPATIGRFRRKEGIDVYEPEIRDSEEE